MFHLILSAQSPAGSGNLLVNITPFILMLVLFYFLLIRPQIKREKLHRQMQTEIARGDQVVTNGGLMGKVTKSAEDDLTIEIADGVRVKVKRAMVALVTNRTEPAHNNNDKTQKSKKKK